MRILLKPLSCAAAMICTVMPGIVTAQSYDCQLSAPRVLNEVDGGVSLSEVEFPQLKSEKWQLQVRLTPASEDMPGTAKVMWPSDPMQIAGEFPYLPTANDAVVFSTVSFGPCMFTEVACVSLVQIAEQGDGKADILIQPSALWGNKDAGTAKPFVAVIQGSCKVKGSKK